MARTDLGPSFPLDESAIRHAIKRKSPGVYVCGRREDTSFKVEHVGRSDSDVAEAVRSQIGGYTHFKFRYYDTPGEAFEKECFVYHDFGDRIDNDVHPESPPGVDAQCPACGPRDDRAVAFIGSRKRHAPTTVAMPAGRKESLNDDGRRKSVSQWRRLLERRILRPAVLNDEDEQDLVHGFFGDTPGTFAEVGACEPESISQTFHLELRGWSGVLVEPVAEFVERLRKARRGAVFAVAAGAPEDEGKERNLLVSGPLSTLMPTLVQPGVVPQGVRSVPVRTLDSILAEAGIDRLDFLSIDVEEAELDVLRGISFDRCRPRLILLEDHMLGLAKHRFLIGKGYKLVRRTGLNNWYVPKQHGFAVSLFGRMQLLRKLYLGLSWRRYRYARRRVGMGPRVTG